MVMVKRVSLPIIHPMLSRRPKTRADCEGGVRPCPYVGCRFNLLIDVLDDGSFVINAKYRRPDGAERVIPPKPDTEGRFLDEIEDAVEVWFDEPDERTPSCALDEADKDSVADPERDGKQLDEISEMFYVSRERIRQIEASGLAKLRDGGFDLRTLILDQD